jgi:DNA-binding PadR family transcriptional regulator
MLSLDYMWPRAESNVYAEPKRLVDAGLVNAREQWSGKRRRTVYSITSTGRTALATWLSAPDRFRLSGLATRLLLDQHAATIHWAGWAEREVEGWETPLSAPAQWGIATIRAGTERD